MAKPVVAAAKSGSGAAAKPGGARAGTDEPAGLDKAELKKMLMVARRGEPVRVAFALGGDGKAILVMDKRKQPRALEKELKEGAPDSKNHRFGTASVDEGNPKLVRFSVNKAANGMARKLVVALKGTGFSKVEIGSEDGAPVETDEGEDELPAEGDGPQRAPASPPAAPAASGGDQVPATQAEAGRNAGQLPGQPDATALAGELTGLVKRMMEAIQKDPSQKQVLTELANGAQASLKHGDLDQTVAGIKALRQALAGGVPPAARERDKKPGQDALAPAGADPAMVRKLHKLGAIWDAAAVKIRKDVNKLAETVAAESADHELGAGFEAEFQAVVRPLLSGFEGGLSDLLIRAAKAPHGAEQQLLLKQAREAVGHFKATVRSHPVIEHLDGNPFLRVAVGKTLDAMLSATSDTIR